MKSLSIVYLLFVLPKLLFAQEDSTEKIHEEYIKMDLAMVASLQGPIQQGLVACESYFEDYGKARKKDSLGFGWIRKTFELDGGYVEILGDFYFLDNNVKAFRLSSYPPLDRRLNARYKAMFKTSLPVDSGERLFSTFNLDKLRSPLRECQNCTPSIATNQIMDYMSPLSGTVFGKYGYDPISILENWQSFDNLKQALTNELLNLVMYSINPASRLTAILYYLEKTPLKNRSETIMKWIDTVLQCSPSIEKADADVFYKENARKLLMDALESKPFEK